jgi:acyl carrier protein
MHVSSRTPEGSPLYCRVCGRPVVAETSSPLDDATCPYCGSLLIWFRDRLRDYLGDPTAEITAETSFATDLGADSLDTVELVMELEEEFDINIPDDEAERMKTVGDVIRYLEEHRPEATDE